jgi:hypothetical protein
MWNDTGNHEIKLKDSCYFYEQWGHVLCRRPSTNAGNFDLIRPGDQQSGFILPVKGALEEISTGTVGGSLNECDPTVRINVVYFHALAGKKLPVESTDVEYNMYGLPDHLPML